MVTNNCLTDHKLLVPISEYEACMFNYYGEFHRIGFLDQETLVLSELYRKTLI